MLAIETFENMMKYPLVVQAEFADHDFRCRGHTLAFSEEHMNDAVTTPTSLCNLAYMALYAHRTLRDVYELKHREVIREHAKQPEMRRSRKRSISVPSCSCM